MSTTKKTKKNNTFTEACSSREVVLDCSLPVFIPREGGNNIIHTQSSLLYNRNSRSFDRYLKRSPCSTNLTFDHNLSLRDQTTLAPTGDFTYIFWSPCLHFDFPSCFYSIFLVPSSEFHLIPFGLSYWTQLSNFFGLMIAYSLNIRFPLYITRIDHISSVHIDLRWMYFRPFKITWAKCSPTSQEWKCFFWTKTRYVFRRRLAILNPNTIFICEYII